MARSSAVYPPCARYESRLLGSTRPKSVSRRGSPPSRIRISGESPPPAVGIGSGLPPDRRCAAPPAIPAIPRRLSAAALPDQMPEVLSRERPVHEGVDADRGSDGAGGDIRRGLQAEGPVRRRLPGAYAQEPFGFSEQRLAAGEATGGARADGQHVPLDGEEPEPAQPGGTEYLRPVDHHPVADPPQGSLREIAVSRLNGVEDGDQRLRSCAEAVDDSVHEGGVDHLVPARSVAHRLRLEAGAPECVGVLALVVDLRHPVADPIALRIEAAHVDRLDRADLGALEADLTLVLAERVVDQVQAPTPALRHLRALLGVLARHLWREQVAQGGRH